MDDLIRHGKPDSLARRTLIGALAGWLAGALAGWLAGGCSIFALVLRLAVVELGCRGCPAGNVERFTAMKVLLFCLVYAMAPWVFSVHVLHRGTEALAQAIVRELEEAAESGSESPEQAD